MSMGIVDCLHSTGGEYSEMAQGVRRWKKTNKNSVGKKRITSSEAKQ
jgi:hypothetical protein